jgi:hypothetical protein
MTKNLLFVILSLCLLMPVSIVAQEEEPPESATGDRGTIVLPDWSIKKEVTTIERSLQNYDPLINSLEEANADLKTDLAEYLKNPGDQVLAAKITAKMSSYAKKIVANVDKISSDQDVLLQVFSDLNQKLGKFDKYLDFKVDELKVKVEKYQSQEKELKSHLKELAKKVKEESDPQLQEQYKKEFRRVFTNYNLSARYTQGALRNQQDYETLSKNLKALIKMFDILHDAFATLIGNLEAEKKYLLENIRLQADAIRVQKLVHEGISDGSRAVVNITKKLALLYTQVEGFSKVHEKINRDMAKFGDSTKILGSLVQQIETAPFQSAPTVDKAIDYFYSMKDEE